MAKVAKYGATKQESDMIAEYLKKRNLEAQLKDIVAATNGFISWPNNPTEKLNAIMKKDERIVRTRQGFYKFEDPNSHHVSAAVTRATKPIPEKPALPSAVAKQPSIVVIPRDNGAAYKLRMGDVVHGMVTGVHEYGVFLDIQEHKMSGLIHKSNIKTGKMFFGRGDLEDHFRYGDWVNAKVLSVRSNGRLALSTVDFELPDYSKGTPIAQQLEKLAAKLPEIQGAPVTPSEPVSAPVTPTAPIIPTKTEEPPTMTKTTATSSVTNMNDELTELYEMVRKKVGVISLNGKDALKEIVKQKGLVKVTMALMMANDFEADVSLAFVRHIEQKVNGGL